MFRGCPDDPSARLSTEGTPLAIATKLASDLRESTCIADRKDASCALFLARDEPDELIALCERFWSGPQREPAAPAELIGALTTAGA